MVGPITYGKDDSFFDQLTFANTTFKQKADVVVNVKYVDSFYMINTGDEVIQYSFNGTDVHGDMTPGKGSEALSFSNRRVDHIWFRSPSGNSASVSVGGWAGGGKFKLRTSSNSGHIASKFGSAVAVWELDDPNVELNGSDVSKVPNRISPGTYDLVQTTAADQPLYEATGWDGSAPSMLFDGVSDFMESTVGAALGGTDTPWTIIAAIQIVTATAASNQSLWALGDSSSNTPFEMTLLGTTSIWTFKRDDLYTQDYFNYGHSYTTSRSTLCTVTSGTSYDLYVDGSLSSGGTVNVGDMTVDTLAIGILKRISTGNPANIRVGAIWVYDEELDSTAIADAHAAMTQRWAV